MIIYFNQSRKDKGNRKRIKIPKTGKRSDKYILYTSHAIVGACMSPRICVRGSLEDDCHPCFHGAYTLRKEKDKSFTKGGCETSAVIKEKVFKAEEGARRCGKRSRLLVKRKLNVEQDQKVVRILAMHISYRPIQFWFLFLNKCHCGS